MLYLYQCSYVAQTPRSSDIMYGGLLIDAYNEDEARGKMLRVAQEALPSHIVQASANLVDTDRVIEVCRLVKESHL